MQPPFLDLSFYVGMPNVRAALAALRFSHGGAETAAKGSGFGLPNLPVEVHGRGGCIEIRTEGEAFCGPMRSDTARLCSLGARVHTAFTSVAEKIDCIYGAILIEYSLEEPAELREDPRSLAFQNFYISRRWFPSALTSKVISMVPPGAFVEELNHGVYISTLKEFNPAGVNLDNSLAQKFSTQVAREIGRAIV